MKFNNFFIILLMVFSLISCSEKKEKISLIKEDNLEMQMIESYNEGLKEFNQGDVFFAVKKFNEVELLYPQSIWAPRATLMAAYAWYSQLYFKDAIFELERFLEKYKNHPDINYAYYLLALSHYNLIQDEKKDLGEIIKARKYFNFELDIQGSEGRLLIGNSGRELYITRKSKRFKGFQELEQIPFPEPSHHESPFIGGAKDMIKSLRTGKPSFSNGKDALKALEIIYTIYK